MKLVVDANVLFAAFLRDGATRHLLFDPSLRLYAPEFILREFAAHRAELEAKTKDGRGELAARMESLLGVVTLVRDKELRPYLSAAAALTDDDKDWLYLAAALKEGADLWTNDKRLSEQRRVKTHTTQELMKKATR